MNWWYKALALGEHEHKDMIPYVIAGLVALVLINIVWRWMMGAYVEAIKDATSLP